MTIEMLADLSAVLLEAYRMAEQLDPEAYQAWALSLLREKVAFRFARWATGYVDGERWYPYRTYATGAPAAPGAFELSVATVDPLTSLGARITFYRDVKDGDFSARERRFLDALGEHLAEGHAFASIQHLLRVTRAGSVMLSSNGVADRHGHVQVAPPDFQRLLRLEWPGWRERELPSPLAQLIREQGSGRHAGRRIVVKVSGMSDAFLLQARKRRRADALSEREREVATLLAGGLTYKEAARRLGLSPFTVRNHISSVFAKLRVNKQSEMAAALRETD